MKLKILIITVLLLNSLFCFGQQIPVKLIDSIAIPKNKYKKFIGIDAYENLFFTHYEVISKINKGKEWVYTNYELGVPSSISILNPLQILVFYKDTNTVIFLDRFLNETRRIDLNNLSPIKLAWWVDNTKSQQIWLYDSQTNQLNYFDYQTNTNLSETIPFLEKPVQLASNFNTAYVLFKNKINQYNIYGTLSHSINIESHNTLKANQSKIIIEKNHQFQVFDKNLNAIGSFKIEKNNHLGFSLKGENLYIYNSNKLYLYQLTYPSK